MQPHILHCHHHQIPHSTPMQKTLYTLPPWLTSFVWHMIAHQSTSVLTRQTSLLAVYKVMLYSRIHWFFGKFQAFTLLWSNYRSSNGKKTLVSNNLPHPHPPRGGDIFYFWSPLVPQIYINLVEGTTKHIQNQEIFDFFSLGISFYKFTLPFFPLKSL